MLQGRLSSGAHAGRAGVRFLALSAALLSAGCAGSGLETGALQLTSPDGAPVEAEPKSPAGWKASVARVKEPDFKVAPETGRLIKESRALREKGDKAAALDLLDKAPNAEQDLAIVKERGLLAAELGKVSRAEELLRKAATDKTPDWRVHSALGATLSAAGRQSDARAEFNKALALAPDHPAILNNLALSFAMEGKQDEAERILRKAVVQDGAEAQAQQNLALVLGLKGNLDEAKRVTRSVLPPDKAAANIAYLETLKTGDVKVSKADAPAAQDLIRAAALAKDDGKPIMQLGSAP
jgi:Flp pilus assembly protein TadD